MNKKAIIFPVFIVCVIAFSGIAFVEAYRYLKFKSDMNRGIALPAAQTGVGSEYNTEKYFKDFSEKSAAVYKNSSSQTSITYIYGLAASEASILGNISTKDEEKKLVAVNAYNETRKINQEILARTKDPSDEYHDVALVKSVVAPYQFFEQYCFRPDWFLESNWAKDDVFVKSFAKYPKEKTMSIFLGFSAKLSELPLQDNVVIGNNMRIVSYLLHSFREVLSEADRDILITRLVALRAAYSAAPLSKIYGNNKDAQIQSLIVTPSAEYAYATEILSRYRQDLVPKSIVVATYEDNISKIKSIVDENDKPIYMVNKFMWINLMYMGYLYEQNDFKSTNKKMYEVFDTLDAYTLAKSTYNEGRESIRGYESAMTNELGSWDQIRKRAYAGVSAVRSERIKNGTSNSRAN